MTRKVRDAALDTRNARRKLKVRGRPYYRNVAPLLHLGYRKLKNDSAGTWIARAYQSGKYRNERIAIADDLTDADGNTVLDFWQAQEKARERFAFSGDAKIGPLTVSRAMDDYLHFLESHRKSAGDARYRYKAFIKEELGSIKVSELTAEQIRRWLADLAKQPPRVRTKKDEKQQYREICDTDESKRRRRSTANRTLTVLKAALNRAWRESDGNISSDAAWRRVEPFENVDAARVQYLTVAQATRLINACDPDFRRLVQAALETGARYGELTHLQVRDFKTDSGTIHVPTSKSGKPRHVVLTDEGKAFFAQVCAGRSGSELMFTKANGTQWLKSEQARPIAAACKQAKISPAIGFHGLRHTWASLAVMAGVPLLVVAKNLGHSDTRMVEKHYGHLAPSYIADAIRAGAPRFGFKPDEKIVTLAGRA